MNQKRIARITWNTNGWIKPSGSLGKSKHKGTHESNHRYGHEEWLFDTGKLIDGYHYGFLEPIRKQQKAYENRKFDVWLYTINDETKKRYWVGAINNIEVLNKETSTKINGEYLKKGWLKEMKLQIKTSGGDYKGFSEWKGMDLLNIRFLPSNMKINEPYFELPTNHPIYSQSRYVFGFYKKEFNILLANEEDTFSFTLKNNIKEENDDIDEVKINTYSCPPKEIQITRLHNTISKICAKALW